MDGKQGQRQLDSSRVHLPVFLLLIAWILPSHSQNQGSSISRTHTTILGYASTLHYKFNCVWKLTQSLRDPPNRSSLPTAPFDMETLYFNDVPWDCIYVY